MCNKQNKETETDQIRLTHDDSDVTQTTASESHAHTRALSIKQYNNSNHVALLRHLRHTCVCVCMHMRAITCPCSLTLHMCSGSVCLTYGWQFGIHCACVTFRVWHQPRQRTVFQLYDL